MQKKHCLFLKVAKKISVFLLLTNQPEYYFNMEILVTGDLHFDKDKFKELSKALVDCDILCLTGDYLDDHNEEREQQIEWVSRWLLDVTVPVLMCSGNHDLDELAECEWIEKLSKPFVFTDNSIWTHKKITFGVIPYIGAQYNKFSKCDVILNHLPPSNTKTSQRCGTDFGDDELYFSITQGALSPKYIFCGHVHNPDEEMDSIKDTTIINASSRLFRITI